MKPYPFLILIVLQICSIAGFCDEPVLINEKFYGEGFSRENIVKQAPKKKILYNQYNISTLNKQKVTFGTYHVQGYVVKVYTCPPCPKGALCKPCMKDHLIISENNRALLNDKLTDQEMIVFVDRGTRLEMGRPYRFLIKFLDFKTVEQPVNDTKLIYYQPVEVP